MRATGSPGRAPPGKRQHARANFVGDRFFIAKREIGGRAADNMGDEDARIQRGAVTGVAKQARHLAAERGDRRRGQRHRAHAVPSAASSVA